MILFIYEDITGKIKYPEIAGKVAENENKVKRQLSNWMPYGYILVTIGGDGATFKNTWMTGYMNLQTGFNLKSPYPF